jgi:hypothetical protein
MTIDIKCSFRLLDIDYIKIELNRIFHIIVICCLIISGCATYVPPKQGRTEFHSRAETQKIEGIRVSAVVLSAEESKHIFGSPLVQNHIQPI